MGKSTKLSVLDLFAGIGGFTLGLHKTNLYETKYFCEWDESCQKVLKKHWPEIPCFGDIKELSKSNLSSDIDVITGGFPCQDISLAGKGAGLEGARSSHWYHYLRLISEIKPKGVIIENVSALRNRGLETVLQNLYEVGYDAEWHCITASYFGAPHERDRIWIIAYRRGLRGEGFKPLVNLSPFGQRGKSRQADLLNIYKYPFERSHSFPQPLLCGMDVRVPRRMDRLKQVGNSVYHPIITELGKHLYKNIVGSSLTFQD